MKPKIFKNTQGITRKISNTYTVSNYLTFADSDKVSVAVGTATNHEETTTTSSDRAYFVLEGQICVNGKLVGKAGDTIYVPGGTEYSFEGTFKAVIINSPPFRKTGEDIKKISG
jgi:ethanolamine utilization protein EutQ (cupin superfamily)